MSVIDLLITIIVVTILVTIVLGVMTYVAYKLRLARKPTSSAVVEVQYFVSHEPPPEPEATRVYESSRTHIDAA